MHSNIQSLIDLPTDCIGLAGGKGASLAYMISLGISVPKGFVVLSSVYDEFITTHSIQEYITQVLEQVNISDTQSIVSASDKICTIFHSKNISKQIEQEILEAYNAHSLYRVAVRSSANVEDNIDHAWAGQLESYLNITKDKLIYYIKECWCSLFSPRAIYYRLSNQLLKQEVSMAVIIQDLVETDVSGVAFTANPITKSSESIVIEGGYGLCEAFVSGKVSPDTYIIDKISNTIMYKHISMQDRKLIASHEGSICWDEIASSLREVQKISDVTLSSISTQAQVLESAYGHPLDIEWGIKQGKLYILQARPITTLHSVGAKLAE